MRRLGPGVGGCLLVSCFCLGAAHAAESGAGSSAPGAGPQGSALGRPAEGPPAKAIPAVTFEQALERARSRNPTLQSAQEDVRRAEALVREARAPSLPTVTLNATGSRIDGERRLGERVLQNAQSLNANAAVVLPVFAPQRWHLWSQASESAEVTRLTVKDVGRQVAITTARAWLAVIAQRRVLEANERASRTARAHYAYAHGRFAGGVGTRLDEVRAEQEMQATEAQLQAAHTALVRTQEALGILLGEEGPVDATGEASLSAPPEIEEGLREATERRTDVKASEARAALTARFAREYWVDYLPSLTAQFQPFYQNPSTVTQPSTGWQAQLFFTLSLYDGGLRQARNQGDELVATQSQIARDALLRQARAEVRTSFEALRRAEATLEATRRSAELARTTLDLATEAYRAGATTNLEVIDAERRALDAETSVAIAEDSARQARLDLLAASGRFP